MKHTSRRDFIKKTTIAASIVPFVGLPRNLWAMENKSINEPLSIHIFSKHLQFLDYKATGSIVAEMGFSGVDLTVRPKGHVLPETVTTDLPKAIAAIKAGGSNCEMITTVIESVYNPLDVAILNAASKSGIKYYRPGWLKYPENLSIEEGITQYKQQIKELSELNKKLGLIGCYQNHAGTYVGASIWEIKQILETAEQDYFGAEYDVRHNVVEGANSWVNGLKLIKDNIKTIVLKDFKWGVVDGKWEPINVPIGEGMVDFKKYFRLLKDYNINVPVSLHMEYPLGGAEKGNYEITVDKKVVFDAMTSDLNKLQKLWKEA
jgi:sugar phosphate isomerase/epimerase